MIKNAIEIRNLKFGYLPGSEIIDIPAFEVERGERLFLYGPSGSGKTTFLGLLAGMMPPRSGTLKVMDQDLGALSPSGRDALRGKEIGYIFQMFNLIPYLNVLENILLPLSLSRDRAARLHKDSIEAVREIASHLKIDNILDKQVTQISVGQQQRVAVARALLGNPSIVLADEPTSALDADAKNLFLELLFSECDRLLATLIFVSHERALSSMFKKSQSLLEINAASGAGRVRA